MHPREYGIFQIGWENGPNWRELNSSAAQTHALEIEQVGSIDIPTENDLCGYIKFLYCLSFSVLLNIEIFMFDVI